MTFRYCLAFACVLLAGPAAHGAEGDSGIGRAVANQYGKAQREFLAGQLAAKPPTTDQPATSLVASHAYSNSVDNRPPLNSAALSRDPVRSGEAWLLYAETLYAEEQFESAAKALEKVQDPYRRAEAERVESLKVRLALRGVGKFPPVQFGAQSQPARTLNKVLLLAQNGDRAGAIGQLKILANNSSLPLAIRHRAMIWLALFLDEAGQKQEALAVLTRVDAETPDRADALLAYVRISADVHPSALGAVEKLVGGTGLDANARWELREHLVRALQANGAYSQAAELILETGKAIADAMAQRNQDAGRLAELSASELAAAVPGLPAARRYRAERLLQHKENLLKTDELLKAWRPHMESYLDRIRSSPPQFADEIRNAKLALTKRADGSTSLAALFHLEMSKLIGKPSDRSVAYGLFFGLAQWEFGYEYPLTWRPPAESPGEQQQSRGDRRRAKELQQQQEKEDKRQLPKALDHLKKLQTKVSDQLANIPRVVFEGMVDEAKSLIQRDLDRSRDIQQLLPKLDAGIRDELIQDARERKLDQQLWLNRFAHHALKEIARENNSADQPYFKLDATIAPAKGESLLKAVAAVQRQVETRKAAEVSPLPLFEALKSLIAEGETRRIRADALRLRAQMAIALYESQAVPVATEAVVHYRTLLRDYSDLVDRADVTYQLARAQDLAQRGDDSLKTLLAFVKAYPRDPRASEAIFRIGELQFALAEYQLAKGTYESVIRQADSRFRDQAEYKLGWTLFKLGDHRGSLPRFIAVIDRAYGDDGGDDKTRRNRLQDAFRAISLAFSNLNGAPDVERYFEGKNKRTYIAEIYQSLARYYLEHSRVNDAVASYGYLNKHYPDDPRAPILLADIAAEAGKEKLAKLALELQEQFVNRYSISGTFWSKATPDVREQIGTPMKSFLATLAQLYHADAQQNSSRDSHAKAIRYYQQYVATFPLDGLTPNFHFLLAEARYETNDLENAMVDYEAAAYRYGMHPKAAEAGYALLVATQKRVEEAKEAEQRKAGLRLLVERSTRFAGAFPGDVRVDTVLVKAGEDILMLGEAAEAVRLSETLLARNPGEQINRRALLVSAHGYFESGAFAKAEAAYQQVLALKGFTAKEQKELTERLGLSVYRQAEGFRTAGDQKQAIDTFLRVAKTAPGTEPVPNAEIDAASLLISGKRWAEAIAVLERFARNHAGHKLNADVPVRLAVAYENDGRFLKAGEMLESLAQSENDEPLARQMLLRSAELREKGARTDLATATYEKYLMRYPQPVEKASEVRQILSEFAAKAQDVKTRDRWLNELVVQAKTPAGRESVRVRYLAAKASVVLGDGGAAVFESVKLTLPFEKSLAGKQRAMELAFNWYQEAGRFGVAEVTTEATYKTAELYKTMSKDVMTSERPGGLSELELGQYNILLEEQAAPIEDKAVELHEINYGRIRNGVYDEWVKKSLVSLRTLSAGKYDKVEVPVPYFAYAPPKPVAPPEAKGAAKVETKPGPAAEAKTATQAAPAADAKAEISVGANIGDAAVNPPVISPVRPAAPDAITSGAEDASPAAAR